MMLRFHQCKHYWWKICTIETPAPATVLVRVRRRNQLIAGNAIWRYSSDFRPSFVTEMTGKADKV